MPSASQREVANAVFTSFSFTDLRFCWEHLLTELQNFVNPIILLQNSEDRKMTQSMWMLEIKFPASRGLSRRGKNERKERETSASRDK